MAKSMNGQAETQTPATEKQKALLNSLLDELAYSPETASDITAKASTKEEAGQIIEDLLAEKAGLKKDGLVPGRVNGFDKIAFSMCFKMVWNAYSTGGQVVRVTDTDLIEKVWYCYELYTDAFHYVKAKVAEGGQQ